jgi:DNA modification methylase
MCFPNSINILDPYSGSGTTAIASHNLNKNFVGCEISEKAFNNSIQRIKNHVAQQKLF